MNTQNPLSMDDPQRKSTPIEGSEKLTAGEQIGGELNRIDEQLGNEIHRVAQTIQPDQQFQANLEKRLVQAWAAQPKSAPTQAKAPGRLSSLRPIVWVGLAVVLLLVLVWGIRNLLPSLEPKLGGGATPAAIVNPYPGATQSSSLYPAPDASNGPVVFPYPDITPVNILPTVEDLLPVITATPEQPATSSTQATAFQPSPFFPDGGLALQVELPSAPPEMDVYRQLPYPVLTPENARQVARQLGVNGDVYVSAASPTGEIYYTVTDGSARVDFMNSPDRFYYTANPFWVSEDNDAPPSETLIASAEAFLKEHSLLDGQYQVEIDPSAPGAINFMTSLNGQELRVSLGGPPQIQVRVGSDGQVLAVNANLLKFEKVGEFPIITAHQAFDKLVAGQMEPGVEQGEHRASPPAMQTWRRIYPDGQHVELFGNLELLAAVDPGKPPFAAVDGYPLKGDSAGLIQTNDRNTLFQVVGKMQTIAKGGQELLVEGWQVSPLQMEDHTGTIQRENGLAYLLSSDQHYFLPDLPADVPEGQELVVTGVVFNDPELTINWRMISNGRGSGGGGGSASGFRELNLDGSPTPVPTLTAVPPYQTGQKFEALEGTLYITAFEQSDGSLKYDVSIQVDPTQDWPGGLYAKLAGPGLAGIETLNHRPVRIWGTFGDVQDYPPVWQVERYEAVDPGAVYQGWIGTTEPVNLGGQAVMLFTTQTGEQYIIGDSIDTDPDPQMGNPGELIVVEGFLVPGDSFAGLPVIRQSTFNLAAALSDPSGYIAQLGKPPVVPAAQSGAVTIDKVELVYSTPDAEYVVPAYPGAPLFAQPAWRFTGHTAGGLLVELQVQALNPTLLK